MLVSRTEVLYFIIETRSPPALARCYPRSFTFYVARPARSIFPSAFLISRQCWPSFFLPCAVVPGLRAIASTLHLRMLPAHFLLLMLSAHLLLMMLRTHLLLMMLSIHLLLMVHRILPMSGAFVLCSFSVHHGLVSFRVLIVAVKSFCLVFVPVFSGIHPFSLTAMFSHLPWLVFTLSRSSCALQRQWPFPLDLAQRLRLGLRLRSC